MKKIRCTIYTRKLSEEGLDQEFNSLDAQRESCEAFITSQKAEGWVVVPEHYDDGGISGGTLERPSLKRLLHDVDEGLIDQIADQENTSTAIIRHSINLAFLAPDIIRQILDGKQPIGLTSKYLQKHLPPSSWQQQRELYSIL